MDLSVLETAVSRITKIQSQYGDLRWAANCSENFVVFCVGNLTLRKCLSFSLEPILNGFRVTELDSPEKNTVVLINEDVEILLNDLIQVVICYLKVIESLGVDCGVRE